MNRDFLILKILKLNNFSNLDIDQILNYLESFDYDLNKTRYIGQITSKNERLAKYFFLRDKLRIETNSSINNFHIDEILDQCIDWSEFWRLLVIKKGFCCIRLTGESDIKFRFIFLSGPNLLSGPSSDQADSIFEDVDYLSNFT